VRSRQHLEEPQRELAEVGDVDVAIAVDAPNKLDSRQHRVPPHINKS
jgi:hypothetical protein